MRIPKFYLFGKYRIGLECYILTIFIISALSIIQLDFIRLALDDYYEVENQTGNLDIPFLLKQKNLSSLVKFYNINKTKNIYMELKKKSKYKMDIKDLFYL